MQYDTIVSQATPAGFSAIAIIRLSGPRSLQIAKKLSKQNTTLAMQNQKFVQFLLKEKKH